MIVSGMLSLAGLIGVPLANMQIRVIGVVGYAPIAFLVLGFVFRQTRIPDPTSAQHRLPKMEVRKIYVDFLLEFYYIADEKDSKMCAKQDSLRGNEYLQSKEGNKLFSTFQSSRTIIFTSMLKRLHHWLKVTSRFFCRIYTIEAQLKAP